MMRFERREFGVGSRVILILRLYRGSVIQHEF